MNEKKPSWFNRRNFIKMVGVGAGAAGTLAVLPGSRSAADAAPEAAAPDHDSAGYRVTEHVQLYYELARR